MIYLPIITAQDYESFCGLLNSQLPHAYDKWLKLHSVWHHHYLAERNQVRDVQISADKFAAHLKKTGRRPDMDALLAFAELTARDATASNMRAH